MKHNEISFYSFKQFEYFLLQIVGNKNSVEVFRLFSMYLKNKPFKYLKKQSFFLAMSSVTFHMYLDSGRDDDDDSNSGESNREDYYE